MREPEIDVTMMRGGGGGEGDGCATKMSFGRPLPFCRCDAASAAPQSYPPKGPKMRREGGIKFCGFILCFEGGDGELIISQQRRRRLGWE